ncbi:hypothetical protein DU500_07670 [Haloplanus rubicundus]|uniref:Uncharacterized protein n=1 Tax=Haloplanus rubicundus TaxID=1547898 RepID=A0A345E296_9EURY|nr:hypothetical protein DU500_07670 [Haloplanus rubicundus]
MLVGAQRWETGVGAEPEGDARFQATSMNPAIPDPDPEWTYEQPTLVNPTVAGRTAFVGGAELTALDLLDGTERWSSDDIAGRIVAAPTVTPEPEVGHSIDDRIRHQTLNHHDELGSQPANFRVGAGRLSAAGLTVADEYWFPDEAIEPRSPLDSEARYVGQVEAAGRITVPRNAIVDFQTEHGTTPGLVIQLHNTGGVTTEKPVEVRVGETTLDTTVPIQGYGTGVLCLFEDLAAAPGYVESGLKTDSARTYFDGASLVEFSGEQLLTGTSPELTVSTPDHERTIRFEGAASGDTPERTDSPEGTESSTAQTEPVDGTGQNTTEASGPGFGTVTTPAAIAAGGYARYVWQKRNDNK